MFELERGCAGRDEREGYRGSEARVYERNEFLVCPLVGLVFFADRI